MWKVVLTATMLLVGAAAAHAATVSNLLTNGGFEDGLNGWTCDLSSLGTCDTSNALACSGSAFQGYSPFALSFLSQSFATTAGTECDPRSQP